MEHVEGGSPIESMGIEGWSQAGKSEFSFDLIDNVLLITIQLDKSATAEPFLSRNFIRFYIPS